MRQLHAVGVNAVALTGDPVTPISRERYSHSHTLARFRTFVTPTIKLALPYDLAGDTPQDEAKAIQASMEDPKSNLKLVYVTPEKVAKSKRFMSKLEKMHKAGRLARCVHNAPPMSSLLGIHILWGDTSVGCFRHLRYISSVSPPG